MEQNNYNQFNEQEQYNQQQQENNQFQKEEQQKKNKKVSLMIIGVAILVIGLVGITYAFFNYTRTGSANTIKTGHIAFNAEQSAQVTLSDLFPITVGANETITPQTPGVGSLTIHVTGDTSYSEGIEYLIKAVNVTGNNGTNLPISIAISYEANTGKSIGTEDEDYYTNRGGNTSVYKVLSNDTIEEGKDLVVGYIAPDNSGTGIDGTLTVMAYLDARNIAITDTYPEGTVHTVKTTEYSSQNCEAALTGVANASTYCTSASSLQDAIDNGLLTSEQITLLVNAGIVEEYTDGTTDTWVNGRTVLTTEQWNGLQASGVSFQIKAEANEGTWVYTNESCFTVSGNAITAYDVSCGGTDVVIPSKIGMNTITTINNSAFSSRGLTSVTLPNSINVIDGGSFNSNNLSRLIITENVTSIGPGAFASNKLEYLEINSPNLIITGTIFPSNSSSNFTALVNIKDIPTASLAGAGITSLTLGTSVETIGSSAFYGSPITSVTIPNSVTSWYCNAFANTVIIDNQSGVECTS